MLAESILIDLQSFLLTKFTVIDYTSEGCSRHAKENFCNVRQSTLLISKAYMIIMYRVAATMCFNRSHLSSTHIFTGISWVNFKGLEVRT